MAYFLVIVEAGIEPRVQGPFRTAKQLRAAVVAECRTNAELRSPQGEDGAFPAQVTMRNGQPVLEMWTFSGGEMDALREQAEKPA